MLAEFAEFGSGTGGRGAIDFNDSCGRNPGRLRPEPVVGAGSGKLTWTGQG